MCLLASFVDPDILSLTSLFPTPTSVGFSLHAHPHHVKFFFTTPPPIRFSLYHPPPSRRVLLTSPPSIPLGFSLRLYPPNPCRVLLTSAPPNLAYSPRLGSPYVCPPQPCWVLPHVCPQPCRVLLMSAPQPLPGSPYISSLPSLQVLLDILSLTFLFPLLSGSLSSLFLTFYE
ncbi:unnamed protein product [Acanthosepion pharaonis]|uniref:Uncharacterized protein n=1 Tax=Acanthosepion pharaonis TaxID=158019 RepID=A0A812EH95_ACAPH|nr:unnamed protein product [Sepia pharaonis]